MRDSQISQNLELIASLRTNDQITIRIASEKPSASFANT